MQAALDRAIKQAFEFIDDRPFVLASRLLPLVRKIHCPVGALADRGVFSDAPASDGQHLPRRQNIDAFKATEWTWHGEEIEHGIDAAPIRLRFDETGRQYRLDFRTEDEPVAAEARRARPEQRADTEAIAG